MYTNLGRLKYLRHDMEREQPVYFHWQILEGPPPADVAATMELQLLDASAKSGGANARKLRATDILS